MVLSSMLCAVKTWLQSCWRLHYMLMFVWFLDSRALSHCKDDIGALSWSSVETLIREPSPFGRLVRCSAHDTFSRDYVTWNNAQWGGGMFMLFLHLSRSHKNFANKQYAYEKLSRCEGQVHSFSSTTCRCCSICKLFHENSYQICLQPAAVRSANECA